MKDSSSVVYVAHPVAFYNWHVLSHRFQPCHAEMLYCLPICAEPHPSMSTLLLVPKPTPTLPTLPPSRLW